MINLLLSATLLAGIEYSSGLGELNPGYVGVLRVSKFELSYSSQDKYTRGGYDIKVNTLVPFKKLLLVSTIQRRDGKDWIQYGYWAGLGYNSKRVQIFLAKAIDSNHNELKLETRLCGKLNKIKFEYHWSLVTFNQGTGINNLFLLGF